MKPIPDHESQPQPITADTLPFLATVRVGCAPELTEHSFDVTRAALATLPDGLDAAGVMAALAECGAAVIGGVAQSEEHVRAVLHFAASKMEPIALAVLRARVG
jgi:hypothetical protein